MPVFWKTPTAGSGKSKGYAEGQTGVLYRRRRRSGSGKGGAVYKVRSQPGRDWTVSVPAPGTGPRDQPSAVMQAIFYMKGDAGAEKNI